MKTISMFVVMMFTASVAFADETYVPVVKGDKAPFDGVCMTEARSLLMADEKIELKELKQTHAVDLKLWLFKEDQYKLGLKERDERLAQQEEALNGFWNRNKFEIGVVGGFIIGAALTIGIASAVAKSTK